jgi:hypothetical protein
LREAHRLNGFHSKIESFANAVHSIHYTAIAGQDDGKAQVTFCNKTGVTGDLAAGDWMLFAAIPEGLVEFANRRKLHLLRNQTSRQLDKALDAPGAESLRRVAEMVLGAHGVSSPGNQRAANRISLWQNAAKAAE